MAQHDYNIANQTAANARTDINNVLSAIATNNSGTSAPSTTFANQWWYDTDAFILYIRANGNDAWIPVAYLDQTNDKFRILDDTQVVNTSGTQTGLLGDQATATWETGTGTVESLVSPAKVKAAIDANVTGLGFNQTWQNLTSSRSFNTIYQNTTGIPIAVNVTGFPAGDSTMIFQVSSNSDMSSSVQLGGQFDNNGQTSISAIIPDDQYYRVSVGSAPLTAWAELR